MNLTEVEQRAVKELMDELQRRLELETRNLGHAQFELTKLRIRASLFGEETLDDRERKALVQAYPEDIAKHQTEITRLQAQLAKLGAYGKE